MARAYRPHSGWTSAASATSAGLDGGRQRVLTADDLRVRWPDAAERSPAGGDLSAEETVMRSLARWCVRHRLAVLGIWLMVLVGTFLGQSALGSHYATGTTLTGTPSAAAANLLQRAVPGQ